VKKVVVYSKDGCNFCIQALRACKQIAVLDKDFKYIVLKLHEDYTDLEFKMIFPDCKYLPQIIVDGTHVGGWDEWKPQAIQKLEGA
tara:strand:+ start:2381 stop:2638 length:258 start_codon:yes stop_codon:yes gene_type:complete